MTRAAYLMLAGVGLLLGVLLLDTWRAGEFFLRWGLGASIALIALGFIDLVLVNLRQARPGTSATFARLLPVASVLLILVSGTGFTLLERKGYSANVAQFVRLREDSPFGPAQFDRGADGAIHIRLTHGSGVAVERTMFGMDATPSAEQLAGAQRLLEVTRAAAPKFADFTKARTELGFTIAASELEGDDSPGTEHLVNPDNMRDARMLDPDYPESLVFSFLPTGEKKLVAIMYMTRPGQNGPQVGGPLTRWHWHPTAPACMDEYGVILARKVKGACPKGLSAGPTSEMLHVWLVEHSYGVFAHLMGSPGKATGTPGGDHSAHGEHD